MKPAVTTLTLSAGLPTLASSPALAADGAAPAIISTGGSVALIGMLLVSAGAIMLSRTRGTASEPSAVDVATAEAAATAAPASADAERLLRAATAADEENLARATPTYYAEPETEETIQYRGGVLTTSSARKTVTVNPPRQDEDFSDDEIAQQMLEALRAERARRGA